MKSQIDYQQTIFGTNQPRLGNLRSVGLILLENILETLSKTEGKILDAGCGAGGMTKAIKFYKPNLKIFGVDISQKAITQAQKNPSGVNFATASINQLPFANNNFNVVIALDVLEHLNPPDQALSEIHRVLKPGGLLFISIPVEKSLFTFTGWIEKLFHIRVTQAPFGHLKSYSLDELVSILGKYGFIAIKHKFWGFFFYQLVLISYLLILKITPGEILKVKQNVGNRDAKIRTLLDRLDSGIVYLVNLESQLFQKFPGGYYAMITCQKT